MESGVEIDPGRSDVIVAFDDRKRIRSTNRKLNYYSLCTKNLLQFTVAVYCYLFLGNLDLRTEQLLIKNGRIRIF